MDTMLTEDFSESFQQTQSEDDGLFGDEVEKPKAEKGQLKVEIPSNEDEDMEDLFGDGELEDKGDRASSPTTSNRRESSEALSESELKHRRELEYEEDENQEENVVELKHAMLTIPNIPMPKSSDGNNWVMRLPNFVKLDSKPYHPDSYVGPESAEGAENTKEKSMSIKLEVENTIRWRWIKDEFGGDKRQSNSRIIRWSDGSMSLLLGKELFDISLAYDRPSSRPQASAKGTMSQSQSQTESLGNRPGGLSYLVAQHKRPGILQAEVPIAGQMTLRPTGMQSETHRKLARAVGQKHSRVSRLRIAPDSVIESELQESQKSSQKRPRKPRASGGESMRRKRSSFGRRRESVWSDDEPEAGMFDTDEEEGDYDSSPRKVHRGAETRRDRADYQTDDFVVADSSEGEDSDAGGKRKSKNKSRKRNSDEEEGGDEMDALDELDAKIARNEEENRRKKKSEEDDGENSGPSQSIEQAETQDVDMEIESEEEEEEFNIRRTGTGSRKKRAIALEDDEEE